MTYRLSWILGLIFWSFQLTAQASFSATVSQTTVEAGQVFSIQYKLENEKAVRFISPDFAPFKKISGPSTSNTFSSFNGVVSQQSTWTFQILAPSEPGSYQIPPALVEIDKVTKLQTKPIKIEVVPSPSGRSAQDNTKSSVDKQKAFFLSVETDVKEAYPGQLIVLTCKIYSKVNLASIELLQVPEIAESAQFRLKQLGSQTSEEIINGTRYLTKTIQRLAILPQRPGSLIIDPFVMRVAKEDETSKTNWFFFNQNLEYETISSQRLTVKINPLPTPTPEAFKGAVGQFEGIIQFSPSRPKAGQTLTMTLRIRGTGDLKRLQAPEVIWPEGFDSYDILTGEESYTELVSGIIGEKTFEYILVPQQEGSYYIDISYLVFDPKEQTYAELFQDKIGLFVLPAENTEEDTEDYTFMDPEDLPSSPPGHRGTNWLVWTGLGAVMSLGVLWLSLLVAKRKKSKAEVLELMERQTSIHRLQQLLDHGETEKMLLEFQRIIYRWVGNKTGLDHAVLTRSDVQNYLKAANLPLEDKEAFVKLLSLIDSLLYAPAPPLEDMNQHCTNAINLIKKHFH